jgi:branched-chain amino acid transport system substrate-binding protein
MKRFTAFSAVLTLFLVACQSTVEGETIKLGFIGPLTGDASAYGIDPLHAMELAVDEINEAGGVNGAMVEIVAEDSRCTGADGASAAQKLIHVNEVVAIVGGQCSGETLAAAPIAEAAQVVMISPISSSPDVTEAGDFIFRDYPSDALKTKAMANYFEDEGFSSVAIISENTDFAVALRDALLGDLPEGEVVFDELVEPNTKDYRTLVTRLSDEEFDVFVANGQTPAAIALMIQQFREQGMDQLVFSHDVADNTVLLELAPDASEGLQLISVPIIEDETDFADKFVGRFGPALSNLGYVGHGYDATNVLLEAIAAVGTEGSAIRDYLYDLEAYNGVVGTFSFDENGDVIGIPYVLREVKDGAFVNVKDIPVN